MHRRIRRYIRNAVLGLVLVLPVATYAVNENGQKADKRMLTLQHIEQMGDPITTATIIGKTVKDNNGIKVGKVEQLIVNRTGKITHAIVSSNGFLGVDNDLIPVPWEVFDLNRDFLITPHDGAMTLAVSKNTLIDAPRINGRKYPVPSDVTKLDIANQYFKEEIRQRHKEWQSEFEKNRKRMSDAESSES